MDDMPHYGPDFPSSVYERGPTSRTPDEFPFERRIREAIEDRCGGRATSPQHGMADDMSKARPACPGHS